MSSKEQSVSIDELMRHAGWIRALAAALVADPDLADDLAQETMIAALGGRGRIETGVRPWLHGILRNMYRMYCRSTSRRRRYESEVPEDEGMPTPESMFQTMQAERALGETLAGLEEPFRSTLLLRFYHGLSAAEIARHHKIPQSTVRSRVASGLDQVRRGLDERHGGKRDVWRRALVPLALVRMPAPVSVGTASAVVVAAALVVVAGGLWWKKRSDGAATRASARAAVLAQASRAEQARGGEPPLSAATKGGADRASPPPTEPPAQELDLGATPPVFTADDVPPCTDGVDPTGAAAGDRPRLLIGRQRLCELRAEIARAGSVRAEIFAALKARVDQNRPELFGTMRLNASRSQLAHASALVYLITGQRRYARQAYEAIAAIYADPGGEPTPDTDFGLGRASTGVGLALGFDWAYNGLDPSERELLATKLRAALDAWPAYTHWNLQGARTSHWVAACRGTEVLQLLAVGDEESRAERLALLETELRTHATNAFGFSGISHEGITNVEQGGAYLLPAVFALAERGHADLRPVLARRSFWQVLMFSGALGTGERRELLATGRATGLSPEEGWASLLHATVPPNHLPEYRSFYERWVGRASGLPFGKRYERRGIGHVWALLYHPGEGPARDPKPLLGSMLRDDLRSAYFFRQRWQDADDITVAVLGDRKAPRHGGMEIAEAFRIALRAYGVNFSAGDASKTEAVSGLLVDGRAAAGKLERGEHERVVVEPRGGYVVLDGGTKYQNLGLSRAKRHVLVDFSGRAAPALLSTLDRVRAGREHLYTWQLAPGRDADERARLAVSSGVEGGRPTFLVRAPSGAFLKGWVVHPADAAVSTDGPLRVETRGSDADLWVVLTVGQGEPPAATITGAGLASKVQIGAARVAYAAGSDRVQILAR